MNDKEKNLENQVEEIKPAKPETDDWYTLALEDMEEFIESQGIYIRQKNRDETRKAILHIDVELLF